MMNREREVRREREMEGEREGECRKGRGGMEKSGANSEDTQKLKSPGHGEILTGM